MIIDDICFGFEVLYARGEGIQFALENGLVGRVWARKDDEIRFGAMCGDLGGEGDIESGIVGFRDVGKVLCEERSVMHLGGGHGWDEAVDS